MTDKESIFEFYWKILRNHNFQKFAVLFIIQLILGVEIYNRLFSEGFFSINSILKINSTDAVYVIAEVVMIFLLEGMKETINFPTPKN